MNRIIQVILLRSVAFLHRLTGRDRSRLTFRLARWCHRRGLEINLKTSDGLRWRLFSGAHVDCLIAMEGEEPHIIDFLKSLDLSDACVVDMGANVGGLTLRFAQAVGSKGRVIAYEPNPIVADRLRANLALNGMSHVEVLQMGVWSEPGSFTLYLPKHGNSGTASLVDTNSNEGGQEVEIQTESFDSRWQACGQPEVKLVKMDIQGAETEALKGMETMIKACRPGLIIEIEGAGDNLPQRLSALAKYLSAFGYQSATHLLPAGSTETYPFGVIEDGSKDAVNGDFYFC